MLLATASPSRGKLSSAAASFRYQPRCPAAAQSFSRNASPATSLLLQLHRRPDLFAEAVNLAAVWVFPYCQRSAPCTTVPASFCSSSPAPPFFLGHAHVVESHRLVTSHQCSHALSCMCLDLPLSICSTTSPLFHRLHRLHCVFGLHRHHQSEESRLMCTNSTMSCVRMRTNTYKHLGRNGYT